MDAFASLLFLLLLQVSLVHCLDSIKPHTCKAPERDALLQFKSGVRCFGGMLSSWNIEEDCCNWEGVICSNTSGHVLQLRLPGNASYVDFETWIPGHSLEGEIHPSLSQLKFLEHLDLSGNNFSGTSIPAFFGSFGNLKHLNLARGRFVGAIPHQLGNLSNLWFLDLTSDDHSYILNCESCEWLSHLSSLKHLALSNVLLSNKNIFKTLNRLPAISHIELSSCGLYLLPTYFPHINFTLLKYLDLSSNALKFNSSNSWFGNITSLEYLDLGENMFLQNSAVRDLGSSLEDIFPGYNCTLPNLENLKLSFMLKSGGPLPKSIWSCRKLKMLDLTSNGLVGSIPESIGTLTSLEHLSLSFNNLQGYIPSSIGMIRSLKHVDLSNNGLKGLVPPVIGTLRYLEYLDLSYNSLNGCIPSSIGLLTYCKELGLSNNELSGDIPESLWKLGSLSRLELAWNPLSGVVTDQHFSNMSKLQMLSIGGPSLDLVVPSRWVPPFRLTSLEISMCKVARELPPWIMTQDSLGRLTMTGSCVKGQLPTWIWHFSSYIYFLNLSSNMIIGEIPDPAGSSINQIDLSSNNLNGSISSFSTLYLQQLNLNNNSLSGNIILNNTRNLSYLDLSMNYFHGRIPSSVCKSSSMNIISLSYNRLHGQIPECFWAFRDLSYLRLNNNYLTGTLPTSYWNLTSLIVLDLSYNKLSGTIPNFITGSDRLLALSLRSNMFYGNIPKNLLNSSSLQILDLADNKLRGSIPRLFGNFASTVDTGVIYMLSMYEFGDQYVQFRIKGRYLQYYRTQLEFVTAIDLSGNFLTGEMPTELGKLNKLMSLNLSNNLITGSIPDILSNMSQLESLDLSRNNLSGSIPLAFEKLSSLSDFDVSYNNLSGMIPTGGQFSTYPNTSYIGNPGLCGRPLTTSCYPTFLKNSVEDANVSYFDMIWVSIGMTFGTVFGFWAFWGPLLLLKKWRYAYFRKLDDLFAGFCAFFLWPFKKK